MVNPILNFSNSAFGRTGSTLSRDIILANIQRLQDDIALTQQQLSSGVRLVRPSIDPIATRRVLDVENLLRKNSQYTQNIDRATTNLNFSDTVLTGLKDIVERANQIILSNLQTPFSDSQRQTAALEVSELLRQAANLGNSTLEGRFIFAGQSTASSPMSFVGNLLAFGGTNDQLTTNISDGIIMTANVLPNESFGVYSDGIRGENTSDLPIDLNPALTLGTRLSALNGGLGVTKGQFSITGSGTSTIDISIAETVSDTVDLINQRTSVTGVTASITTTGITLTRAGGGNITVQEVFGGRTAQSLGILTSSTGSASPFTGTDLNPAVTKDTTLSSLLGGVGLSTSGIVITNQTSSGSLTATIGSSVFSGTNTIEDVLNAINGSSAYVKATINSQGTGIDVFSRLSGARLSISENGGTTASELGLLYTASRAKLTDLNNGLGIGSVPGDDIRIVLKDGTAITIDADKARNVRELVALIDALPNLTATLNPTNSIVINDTTGGAGTFRITNIGGSFAATNLGIEAETAGATISGTSLNFVGVQVEGIFTSLIRLRDGLSTENGSLIAEAKRILDIAQRKVLDSSAIAGLRVQTLELVRNRLDREKLDLEKFRSQDKDIDMAEVASRFQLQMNTLQSALLTSVRAMQLNIFNLL